MATMFGAIFLMKFKGESGQDSVEVAIGPGFVSQSTNQACEFLVSLAEYALRECRLSPLAHDVVRTSRLQLVYLIISISHIPPVGHGIKSD